MNKIYYILALILVSGFSVVIYAGQKGSDPAPAVSEMKGVKEMKTSGTSFEKATFAGGCFWCMTPPFKKLDGVKTVTAGYTGGEKSAPTYEEVSTGSTGHLEAVEVTYDPSLISYDQLLDVFWKNIDPTDEGGQFADRGPQYATAIYYHNNDQKIQAEASKKRLDKSGKFNRPVVTAILPAPAFYPAEDYHQDYNEKNPLRYKLYRSGSGREQFLEQTWRDEKDIQRPGGSAGGYRKPPMDELKRNLTKLQFDVTQGCGTEQPFNNEYWDNKREGIYVDRVSGEPLFSSLDKYDSGTGWPSYKKALNSGNIIEKEDRTLALTRMEVRSRHGDSHLGHVFDDGPGPDGRRYCINSAALRFVPKEDLEKEGYGEYLKLFK